MVLGAVGTSTESNHADCSVALMSCGEEMLNEVFFFFAYCINARDDFKNIEHRASSGLIKVLSLYCPTSHAGQDR